MSPVSIDSGHTESLDSAAASQQSFASLTLSLQGLDCQARQKATACANVQDVVTRPGNCLESVEVALIAQLIMELIQVQGGANKLCQCLAWRQDICMACSMLLLPGAGLADGDPCAL